MNKFVLFSSLVFAALLLPHELFASKKEATYSVPVPSELQSYSVYPLDRFQWKESPTGAVEVAYDLPELLLGHKERVSFRGSKVSEGAYIFGSDQYGRLDCRKNVDGFKCKAAYLGLKVDLDQVNALFLSRKVSDEERQGRLAVSARFGGDMVGVLLVPVDFVN